MDGISKVKIKCRDLHVDGTSLQDEWQVYLRIVGTFSIHIDTELLYSEPEFCVVEFAIQSIRWLRQVALTQGDFIYKTLESSEEGFVWIKKEDDKWRIGSIYEEYEEQELFSLADIKQALESYFDELHKEVALRFGRDINELFSWIEEDWGTT